MVTLGSLRCQVAKVSQFPLFIADTIRANFCEIISTT